MEHMRPIPQADLLEMVKKEDWKNYEMPAQTDHFLLERPLAESELALLRRGHLPQEMEDKWFVYCEEDTLYIHRSWTGYCIYQAALSQGGTLEITVNRDPAQYTETDIECDRLQLNILLNQLTGRRGETALLMKAYLARKRKAAQTSQ